MTAWKMRPSKAVRHTFALSLVDGLLAQAASFCLSVTESLVCHNGLVNHIFSSKDTEAVSTFHVTWHLFTAVVTNSNHSFITFVISANIQCYMTRLFSSLLEFIVMGKVVKLVNIRMIDQLDACSTCAEIHLFRRCSSLCTLGFG